MDDFCSGQAQRPLFSVLVPTYNQAEFLPIALNSLLAQSEGDWEAIVVNDGSKDRTREVMSAYAAADARIRTFHKENGGTATALNEGIRVARGQWVTWLSSDDLYEPDALATFKAAILSNSSARFFHANYSCLFHETNELFRQPETRVKSLPAPGLETIAHFGMNYLNGITICIERGLFDTVGGFDPTYRWGQDADLWLRMSGVTRLHYINHRTSITRLHAGQGAVGFADIGVFDGSRSCLDYLNKHSFEGLFPQLDLNDLNCIKIAVTAVIDTSFNPTSFINYGVGQHTALLERLAEWLDRGCPPDAASAIRRALGSMAIERVELPPLIRKCLRRISRGKKIPYLHRDPIAMMQAFASALQVEHDQAMLPKVNEYLTRIGIKPAMPPGEKQPINPVNHPGRPVSTDAVVDPESPSMEALLYRTDFKEADWIQVLLAFLLAFKAGDPITLILSSDEGAAEGSSWEEVQAQIIAVARAIGVLTFPDIRFVTDEEELHTLLVQYPDAQWIEPVEGGGPPLRGSMGARFAKARAQLKNTSPADNHG